MDVKASPSPIPESLPGHADEVIDTCRALAEELEQLYEKPWGDGQRPTDLNQLREHIHAIPEEQRPLGLAFSGGGIRSATFNLGVLQGLAQIGWLPKFHFLSTVSGGGYIGSWLSAWIARTNFATVYEELRRSKSPPQVPGAASKSPEPDPIRHLRGYSNYLSPVWGLSLDATTLIATYIRNLLINWLVLLPLFAAIVLWPKLNLAVVGALSKTEVGGMLLFAPLILVAIGSIVAIAYTVSDIPGAEGHRPHKNAFYLWFVTPLLLAAIPASWLWPWAAKEFGALTGGVANNMWLIFAASGAMVHMVGIGIGMWWRKKRAAPGSPPPRKRDTQDTLWDALVIVLAGAIGGYICYLGITKIATNEWLLDGPMHVKGYASLAVPFLLGAFALSTTGYAALTRRTRTESDREWWARAGGFLIILTALWLGLHAVALYVPQWVMDLIDAHPVAAPATGVSVGLLGAAIGYWSKNGSRIKDQVIHWTKQLGLRTLDVVCAAFIVGLLAGLGALLDLVIEASQLDEGAAARTGLLHVLDVIRSTTWLLTLTWLALLAAFALIIAYIIGVNAFSMHAMYGNRLVRAYLGASNANRRPHPFTGFDPSDNIKMFKLSTSRNLFHIVNLAINIVRPSSDNLQWQERKAAAFTVTRLHSGSPVLGYRSSTGYGNCISLGRALTISGAAASPSMGYHSSSLVAFVMTIFNVRLGWWLPNPVTTRPADNWRREEPRFGFGSLVSEALSGATADKEFVYLSDGGHFENLALYELVRRRCHGIVVVDAGADPDYQFEDLQSAMRKIRVDLGIPIEFDQDSLPTPDRAKETQCHCAVGKIRYSVTDATGVDGYLIYVKPVLSGDESLDVEGYAKIHAVAKKQFPQQPTSDQFFDESQFESYRWLGYHSIVGGKFPPAAMPVQSWGVSTRAPTAAAQVEEMLAKTR
jgi:Patatin-like phospholipase